MTPESRIKLKSLLLKHEAYKQFPYSDSAGYLTVGVGRNLQTRGISQPEALYLLDEDIKYFSTKLSSTLKFFNSLDENRQLALIDMCFNLGVQGFLNFKQMLLALEACDYERAANEMLESKWADQVKDRAVELANIIRTGTC